MVAINSNNLKLDKNIKKCCKTFAGKCPVTDSWCLNPICAFGCIDDMHKPKQTKE